MIETCKCSQKRKKGAEVLDAMGKYFLKGTLQLHVEVRLPSLLGKFQPAGHVDFVSFAVQDYTFSSMPSS